MGLNPQLHAHAGKLACLEALLGAVLAGGQDAMVVVSSSTAALDLIEARCKALGAPPVRIDGATDVARRHDIVVAFNSPQSRTRVSLTKP